MKKDSHDGRVTSQKIFSLREAIFLTLANNLPRFWILDRYRYLIYRFAGVQQGGKCTIFGPLSVRPFGGCGNIKIGNGSFLNVATNFCVNYDTVTIGERVQVGPRVSFETLGHGLVYVPGKGRGRTSAPIVVEDEVWICAGATIIGGVTIGRGSVVAAGAVVTRDVPPGVLVGGIPARVIRGLDASSCDDAAPAG